MIFQDSFLYLEKKIVIKLTSAKALRSSSTSWPSTTMAWNPKLSIRALYCSISCWRGAGSLWPKKKIKQYKVWRGVLTKNLILNFAQFSPYVPQLPFSSKKVWPSVFTKNLKFNFAQFSITLLNFRFRQIFARRSCIDFTKIVKLTRAPDLKKYDILVKVQILWEGHKIWKNI